MKFSHRKKNTSAQSDSHEVREAFRNIGHEPHVDWVLTLVVGIVVCAVSVASGYFAFMRVGSVLSQDSNTSGGQQTSIDAAGLTRVLDQFETRDRERQDLIKTYKGPTDPSF